MHRRILLEVLDRYVAFYPAESSIVEDFRRFVGAHENCFSRTCLQGHITGSAWVVSADHLQVLLTHHAKLGRWLQLGGHAEGEVDPFAVAQREACEESGMTGFREPSSQTVPLPLDLDIHRIPARGDEPAHLHFDVRYLLVAPRGQIETATPESNELRWVGADTIGDLSNEESLLRMARKARARLRPV